MNKLNTANIQLNSKTELLQHEYQSANQVKHIKPQQKDLTKIQKSQGKIPKISLCGKYEVSLC